MAAPAIPESPHGEHVTVMVFVRHGETEWNASGTVQVDFFHLYFHHYSSIIIYILFSIRIQTEAHQKLSLTFNRDGWIMS